MLSSGDWNITRLDIPSASWEILGDISKALININSSVQMTNIEERASYAFVNTTLNFVNSDKEDIVYGSISVTSRVMISYTVDLKFSSLDKSDFKAFIDDIVDVLYGNNRSEIRRIASMAGLAASVVIPIFRLESEQLRKIIEDNQKIEALDRE